MLGASCAQYAEVDAQQLQIKQRHEPRAAQESLEADYLAQVSAAPESQPAGSLTAAKIMAGTIMGVHTANGDTSMCITWSSKDAASSGVCSCLEEAIPQSTAVHGLW